MSEMIEQAARAIAEELGLVFDDLEESSFGDDLTKDDMIRSARAAISAMREPTEAMLKAADGHWFEGHPRDCWQAMIDAALPNARP